MKIGIIGAGHIGQAIARLAVKSGHVAALSNSRGPDTLRELASQTGCGATTREHAVESSDIVALTIPLRAAFDIDPATLMNVKVIDTNNYYPGRDGQIDVLEQRELTTSEMIASHFSKATIIKAFNAILAKDLEAPAEMGPGRRRALPIAGNDAAVSVCLAVADTRQLKHARLSNGLR